jgi:hypothetical protein
MIKNMTQFVVEPSPNISISDADEAGLPLSYFHLVVLVEPDPETYMAMPGDIHKLEFVLRTLAASIRNEVNPHRLVEYDIDIPEDIERTCYVWVRYGDSDLFDDVAASVRDHVTFTLVDASDLEHLTYYLQGLTSNHPDWRAAVIGGMFEDDVIRIANLIQDFGLETTVLTRYCISNKTFVNLDSLADYVEWLRSAEDEEP